MRIGVAIVCRHRIPPLRLACMYDLFCTRTGRSLFAVQTATAVSLDTPQGQGGFISARHTAEYKDTPELRMSRMFQGGTIHAAG